jgi:hypothetical protein
VVIAGVLFADIMIENDCFYRMDQSQKGWNDEIVEIKRFVNADFDAGDESPRSVNYEIEKLDRLTYGVAVSMGYQAEYSAVGFLIQLGVYQVM